MQTGRVLCVRMNPYNMSPEVEQAFISRYPDHNLRFEQVNPATPEEMRDLAYGKDVVAVYAQDRPLPTIIIAEQKVPFCFATPDGSLRRVTKINVESQPL